MTRWAELNCRVPEYRGVMRQAWEAGWLSDLIKVHQIPCTKDEALRIFGSLHIPRLTVAFSNRNTRGWAGIRKGHDHIRLPGVIGTRGRRLRVGLVLHEAAHILARRRTGKSEGHGPIFVQEFDKLVRAWPWRQFLYQGQAFRTHHGHRHNEEVIQVTICSDHRAIYERHRGPFSMNIVRIKPGKKGDVEETEHVNGPFSAQEAHEHAQMLVNDSRDNIHKAFIWSETENQFIGAFYERGMLVRDWGAGRDYVDESLPEQRVELDDERPAEALVPSDAQRVAEPLPHRDERPAAEPQQPAEAPARRKRSVQTVPKPAEPPKPAVERQPRAAKRPLVMGNREGWPQSKGAQIVFAYMNDPADRETSVKEIEAAIGETLREAGIAFPASLVSRLKQAGFIKEKPDA